MSARSQENENEDESNMHKSKLNKRNYMRNVVVFTGTAIQEIMRDLTM